MYRHLLGPVLGWVAALTIGWFIFPLDGCILPKDHGFIGVWAGPCHFETHAGFLWSSSIAGLTATIVASLLGGGLMWLVVSRVQRPAR